MSIRSSSRFVVPSIAAVVALQFNALPASAAVRYVNASLATGANNGTTWEDAYQGAGGLAAALTASVAGDQIWVAQGSYKPTLTTTRTIFFNLKSGVQIYGGFVGNETLLEERDFAANLTTLTGDLLGNDGPPGSFTNNTDNSHHLINGAGANNTAVLDGFTVTAGFANGAGASNFDKGGGMIFLSNSNATIRNCIIEYNRCTFGGGAVYINTASPNFTDVIMRNNIGGSFGGAIDMANNCNPAFNRVQFIGNQATRAGGVEVFGGSNPTIYNCLFRNNAAGAQGGGGLWVGSASSAALRNCTFANNTSTSSGAGILNSSSTTTIYNSIIWNNTGPGGATAGQQISGGTNTVQYSIVQNGFAGTANLSTDPQFVSATDLHIQSTSPAIDSGNNALVPVTVTEDLDHNPRKTDDPDTVDTGLGTPPLVDRGAYEFTPVITPCPADIAPKGGNGNVDVDDLLTVINNWGATGDNPADITGNEIVDVDDLLAVINTWGLCE